MEHAERRQKMKHFSFVVHICLSWEPEDHYNTLRAFKNSSRLKAPIRAVSAHVWGSCQLQTWSLRVPFPREKMFITLGSWEKIMGKCNQGDADTDLNIAMHTSISLCCFYREYKIFKLKPLIILLLRSNPWEPQEVTKYALNIKEWKILERKAV